MRFDRIWIEVHQVSDGEDSIIHFGCGVYSYGQVQLLRKKTHAEL